MRKEMKYKNFQDYISNCKNSIDSLDYWDDLIRNPPDTLYFIEPDWGNRPIENQAYIISKICYLFPNARQKWMYNKKYILENPYFPGDVKNGKLRLYMMINSPIEFKIRNIYIDEESFRRV